ncbi:uncharacterized protein TNCV_2067221 [Trichonephila clavipes]|uniref:Uncharacterized protein n=1 Tax=Trichonephila clavipes TaxID=2585209 RepID=A0A8X6W3H9_TRICX|nr:uncharacterized protein TNCV_2067221 [Trichonephila clavipes]
MAKFQTGNEKRRLPGVCIAIEVSRAHDMYFHLHIRVAIYRPFGEVSLSLNRTVTCMVLKANDRRTSCPCHDEFRGPRSDYVRQVVLATTTTTYSDLYSVICR